MCARGRVIGFDGVLLIVDGRRCNMGAVTSTVEPGLAGAGSGSSTA
jgi:hypothetical protein